MATPWTIDRDHTAVLSMDSQYDIVYGVASSQPQLLEGQPPCSAGLASLACR